MIVDDDADLDEAVVGIVSSAFGYQGQKCSALSRLIVLPRVRERLIGRLIDATESLRIGDPADPAVSIGPLIDQTAYERVRGIIEAGRQDANLAFQAPVAQEDGWFVGPAIFTGVPPDSWLAQEEIFGPVLSVIDAANLDEALRIANGTAYASTGGFYSRSPTGSSVLNRDFALATSTSTGGSPAHWWDGIPSVDSVCRAGGRKPGPRLSSQLYVSESCCRKRHSTRLRSAAFQERRTRIAQAPQQAGKCDNGVDAENPQPAP